LAEVFKWSAEPQLPAKYIRSFESPLEILTVYRWGTNPPTLATVKTIRLKSFIMISRPERASARLMDWDEIRTFADADIVETLRSSPDFTSATDLRHQYYYAYVLLHIEHRPVVPLSLIGRLFNVSKGTIRWHYKTYLAQAERQRSNGRPSILSAEERDDLIGCIAAGYANNRAWTMRDIVGHISDRYGKKMDANSIRHMLDRDPRVKSCTGVPMEEKRLQVTAEDITAYFHRLAEVLDGVPAHFVFNMDEMGHQEWADRQEQVCYVPSAHSESQVYFPVPRTGKRITLIACIGADGSYLKPLIVIPRKSYDTDLALTGVTDEKIAIYSQAKGYTNRPIFLAWLIDVFLPEVARRRQAMDYEGRAVLMLDNCTAHIGREVDDACDAKGVIMCPFPPHSSNQVQPLDVSTFGITKRHIARVNRMENVNVQSRHIAQVVCSFMSAASPINIVGTFRHAGIALTIAPDRTLFCRVCTEAARCLLVPIEPAQELVPTDDEVEELEAELYLENCVESIEPEVASGNE
jgi:hypothetical protein